jgi:energy-coupling factor transport system ATP-binding protein
VIRFEGASFTYGSAETGVFALTDVTMSVSPGEMVAVLGANGSGKSTLARLTNGLLMPSSGRVTVDGIDTRDEARGIELRSTVGMVFQNPDDQIVATAVEDDVAFGPENLGLPRDEIRDRVDAAIAAVGLLGLERREPHLLSGGQKQRLAIAGALAMRPRYLVLDEPTAMIDQQGRHDVSKVLDSVRAAGPGVLIITHDIAEVAHADRVAVLASGRLVFEGLVGQLFDEVDRLAEWGLELPPIARLAIDLRAAGVPVPEDVLEPEALAEALWR